MTKQKEIVSKIDTALKDHLFPVLQQEMYEMLDSDYDWEDNQWNVKYGQAPHPEG